MILKADTEFLPPELKERILLLDPKSRYLSGASAVLRAEKNLAPSKTNSQRRE